MTNTDLIARAATIKAEALTIDTSATQTVRIGDLEPGDVVLRIGHEGKGKGTTFPFPFTLASVKPVPAVKAVTLTATHGWFGVALPENDPAVIVAR